MRTSVSRPRRFSSALSSAVLEWVLILFLFFEASFSYLVTRFSRRCKLQAPCIVCSRLDHVLGSEQPGFYRDLICNAHKLEISSLAFCHLHQKLADVSTMCETCIISFATEKKSNSETFRYLVGKLAIDHSLPPVQDDGEFQGDDAAKAPLLKDEIPSSSATMICSCCSSPFRHKPHTLRLVQDKAIGVDLDEVEDSMASVPESSNLHEERKLDKIMEWPVDSSPTQHTQDKGSDHFPDVEYTHLKIASDIDPEIPLSCDNNENSPDTQFNNIKEVLASIGFESEPITLVHDNLSAGVIAQEEPIHPLYFGLELPKPVLNEQLHEIQPREMFPCSSPQEGPEGIDQNLIEHKANALQVQLLTKEEVSDTKDISEFSYVGCIATTSPVDVMMDWSSSEVILKTSHTASEPGSSVDNQMDLYDAYKLAVGTRESSMSPTFTDIIVKIDSLNVHEELKLLTSQVSAAPVREVESTEVNLKTSHTVSEPGLSVCDQMDLNDAYKLAVGTRESSMSPTFTDIIVKIDSLNVHEELKLLTSQVSAAPAREVESTEVNLKTSHTVSEPGSSVGNQMDLNDAYKLAVGTRESSMPPTFTDLIVKIDSLNVHEELKLLTSQVSAAPAREVESTEVNLKTSHTVSEPGSSVGNQMDLYDAYKLAVGTRESSMSPTFTDLIVKRDSLNVHEELRVLTSQVSAAEVILKTSNTVSEPGSSVGNQMDLYDAYKLAVGTRESSMSPTFTDLIVKRDSLKVHEELKLLISQVSAARGVESPWHEMSPSPRVYGEGEETILQNISRRLSIERNESGFESLDGSIISEIEGESALERSKRQIELDKKSIFLLYKELEEERNASAIAANQAMAMITKLQEEKAAMQMEALQYQRMMEDQAEYEQESLSRCNEQLNEKEKRIQDLEVALKSFERSNGKSSSDKVPERRNSHNKTFDEEHDYGSNFVETDKISIEFMETELGSLKHPLLCYEDEKAYISNCLSKLEKKLHLFSNNGIRVEVSSFENESPNSFDAGLNGQHTTEHPHDVDSSEGISQKGGFLAEEGPDGIFSNSVLEDCLSYNSLSERELRINGQDIDEAAIMGSSGNPLMEIISQENSQERIFLRKEGSSLGEEWLNSKTCSANEDNSRNKKESVDSRYDFMTLDNEVSHLRQRMEALELDRDFLEHAINSLKNEEAGVKFIQEIACELRELRRNGILLQGNLPARGFKVPAKR